METLRLTLRKFATDDFEDFSELICDRQASEYSVYSEPFSTDEEDLRKLLSSLTESDLTWAIELKAERRVVGLIRLCDENEETKKLEYCIHSDYQGSGYAKEAVLEILRYAKNELKLSRVVSSTASENIPSVQLLNHAGFLLAEEKPDARRDTDGSQIKFTTYLFVCELVN